MKYIILAIILLTTLIGCTAEVPHVEPEDTPTPPIPPETKTEVFNLNSEEGVFEAIDKTIDALE